MTNLARLQATVQDAILHNSSAALGVIAKPARGTAAEAFGIYQEAYILRLTEFLANDHATLHRYMGDVAFNALAKAYATAHPSDQPNARWFSRHLPQFLGADARYQKHHELIGLATLEDAFNTAFDAADCPIFTMADAASLAPQQFAGASFVISTSAAHLTLIDNTISIWSALKAGETPCAPYLLDEPQHILVWRQANASRFRILGHEEAIAIDCLRQGLSFSLICETIALNADPDTAALRAGGYLRGWLEAELVSAVRLATADDEK